MKKTLLTVAMAIACLSSFGGTASSGTEFYADGFKAMVLDDGTAAITWIYGSGDVTIPSEIKDNASSSTGTYTVSAVGGGSYAACDNNITSLTLAEGITSIAKSAFWGKTSITTLVLPSTFTSIGDYAFGNCTGLTTIRISATKAPTVGTDAFKNSDTSVSSDDDSWKYIGLHCTVYVPAGTASTYKDTGTWTYWDSFSNILEPGTVTTGEDGYATYYHWCGYDVPEGVTAYAVTKDDSTLKLVEAYSSGAEVAKSTAVVLKGAANTTYTFDLLPNATATQPTSNLLKGVDNATTITAEDTESYYYKLAKGDKGLGFYWGVAGGGVFELAANKAYLALEKTNSDAHFMSFDSAATGINCTEVAKSSGDNAIYSISGVHMGCAKENLPAGIYVINGKKVIVK